MGVTGVKGCQGCIGAGRDFMSSGARRGIGASGHWGVSRGVEV